MTARGFTLLELLIATTVMAMLALALSGGIRFGMTAWEAGERRSDRTETPAQVHALLRRQIEQAFPLAKRGEARTVTFEGEADRLRFLTLLPERLGVPGLADVTLRLDGSGGREGAKLLMAWQPLGETRAPAAGRVLLAGIERLDFAYFGGDRRGARPDWRPSWTDAGFLPKLVRLRVRLKDGTVWPDLVVAPATTVDSLLD